jgi:hypothetical protein
LYITTKDTLVFPKHAAFPAFIKRSKKKEKVFEIIKTLNAI